MVAATQNTIKGRNHLAIAPFILDVLRATPFFF
jgi:hypothetical protein